MRVDGATHGVAAGLYAAGEVCRPGNIGSSAPKLREEPLLGGQLCWAVQAKSNSGPGGTWSAGLTSRFKLRPPRLSSPKRGISTANPTFSWLTSSGATDYWLDVRDSSNDAKYQGLLTASLYCSVAQCQFAPGVTLVAGNYHWAVQAKNAAGGTFSPDMTFSVQAPPAPTLIAPSGAISTATPTFSWNTSSGATDYWLDVRDSSNAAKYQGLLAASLYCSVAQCQFFPGGVTFLAGSYHWSVQAKNAAGGGAFSPDMNFSVQAPPAPTLIAPSGAISTATPTFS